MKRNTISRGTRGFTLVELLVVMAIIAILASIVVPNVARYITRSNMTNAVSEIKNAETAFTGMLSDAQVANFRQFFNPNAGVWRGFASISPANRVAAASEIYRSALYELMRNGKALATDGAKLAQYGLNPDVVRKLGSNYMEIDKDPWGNLYYVYAGPWRAPYIYDPEAGVDERFAYGHTWHNAAPPFRTRLVDTSIPGHGQKALSVTIRTDDGRDIGYYAPKELPIYIWSAGQNLISGQAMYGSVPTDPSIPVVANDVYDSNLEPEHYGGGDDVNNWDSNRSWDEFYG